VANPAVTLHSWFESQSTMPSSSAVVHAGSTSNALLPRCTIVVVVSYCELVITTTPGAISTACLVVIATTY